MGRDPLNHAAQNLSAQERLSAITDRLVAAMEQPRDGAPHLLAKIFREEFLANAAYILMCPEQSDPDRLALLACSAAAQPSPTRLPASLHARVAKLNPDTMLHLLPTEGGAFVADAADGPNEPYDLALCLDRHAGHVVWLLLLHATVPLPAPPAGVPSELQMAARLSRLQLRTMRRRARSLDPRSQANDDDFRHRELVSRALSELSSTLIRCSDLADISALVLNAARELTQSPHGFVGYIDAASGHLVCPALAGDVFAPDITPDRSIPLSEARGLWGWVLDHREPLRTNHADADPRYDGGTGDGPIRRFLSVPIVLDAQLVGQIVLANAPHDYTQEDLLLAERIGSLYGLALHRLRSEQTRLHLEEQFRQSQKMEAVGRLAGGVAHDFNNQLTVIKGYADLLLSEVPDDHPFGPALEEIRRAADRGRKLTAQLLVFSRRQPIHAEIINLREILRDLHNPLARMIGEDIDLAVTADPSLGTVEVDVLQIEQAVVNLAVNSRDAMPAGGKLKIELENIDVDDTLAEEVGNIPPGRYVMLAVSDTGTGIPADALERIFEPFFTTKEAGKGTGLGLSMVYGFVRQCGGGITCESRPGEGKTFRMYLPRAQAQADNSAGEAPSLTMPEGDETILVAEDDELVRRLIVRVLRQCGYTVLETANAREAVPLGEHYEGGIDLLITDVIMPELTGPELAQRLAAPRPDMKVLYISGYVDRARQTGTPLSAGVNLLLKPFSPQALTVMVRRRLDGPS